MCQCILPFFLEVSRYLLIEYCLSISINIENDIFDIWVIKHDSVARFDSSVDPDSYENWTSFGLDISLP